jgi:hypothetical protein
MTVRSAAWLVLLLARVAHAEPKVVLVETRDGPALPALASQVELHATRRASVQVLDDRTADPLTYAERASQLVASGEAAIVIWIARVDHGFLVFAAGRWPGRAMIELVRADEAIEPAELERTIALKIAGLLDNLLAQDASIHAALGIEPGDGRPEARAGSPEAPGGPERRRSRPSWRIEVATLVAREPHERRLDGRTALAVSRAWSAGGWLLAPTLAAHWQPSGTIEGEGGHASLTELGAALAVEVGRELGPVQVFSRPRLALAALLARGESSDGRRGEATVLAPYGGVEVGARRGISESAQVGLAVGCDLAAIHHEFLIDSETILDIGRARLHVGVSLTVSF